MNKIPPKYMWAIGGLTVGLIFGSKIRQLPLVGKLPKAG